MKKKGVVYTPEFIVEYMCKDLGNIENKKILEPSCGNGNFLRLMNSKNIDCYDIDEEAINKAKESYPYALFFNKDFLKTKIDKKYDIIIGNPPYIRIHDLDTEYADEWL